MWGLTVIYNCSEATTAIMAHCMAQRSKGIQSTILGCAHMEFRALYQEALRWDSEHCIAQRSEGTQSTILGSAPMEFEHYVRKHSNGIRSTVWRSAQDGFRALY